MNLVIIDYGSGNLRSVENAFKNSVKTNKLNFTIQVTNELELISKQIIWFYLVLGRSLTAKKV